MGNIFRIIKSWNISFRKFKKIYILSPEICQHTPLCEIGFIRKRASSNFRNIKSLNISLRTIRKIIIILFFIKVISTSHFSKSRRVSLERRRGSIHNQQKLKHFISKILKFFLEDNSTSFCSKSQGKGYHWKAGEEYFQNHQKLEYMHISPKNIRTLHCAKCWREDTIRNSREHEKLEYLISEISKNMIFIFFYKNWQHILLSEFLESTIRKLTRRIFRIIKSWNIPFRKKAKSRGKRLTWWDVFLKSTKAGTFNFKNFEKN